MGAQLAGGSFFWPTSGVFVLGFGSACLPGGRAADNGGVAVRRCRSRCWLGSDSECRGREGRFWFPGSRSPLLGEAASERRNRPLERSAVNGRSGSLADGRAI